MNLSASPRVASSLLLLLSACAGRPPPPVTVATLADLSAAERLAAGIRLETVSFDGQPDASGPAFKLLHEHLERSFPVVHRTLEREVIGNYSLLFTWRGTEPEAGAILLSAHMDVVPAGDASRWRHPPFSGAIVEGAVWGRGAWDDKGNLFAMMEAVEQLAASGFRPRQSVYLAFGHDEEMGVGAGLRGARAIAAELRARGVKPDFVLDEGLVVVEGAMKGLDAPAALVGVAEKGYLTVALSTAAPGGHSSSPPARSAIGQLSRAVVRLEEHPMPASLRAVARKTLGTLAPGFSWLTRLFLSNLWLFEPVMRDQVARSASGNAMLRSTAAVTVISGGDKENVLPTHAEARVNFRLLPGDTAETVLEHVRSIIDDESVAVSVTEPHCEASRISDTGAVGYQRVAAAIGSVFPEAIVAPGLMVGAPDSRANADLARQFYRFSPLRARPEDLERLHGVDERLSLSVRRCLCQGREAAITSFAAVAAPSPAAKRRSTGQASPPPSSRSRS